MEKLIRIVRGISARVRFGARAALPLALVVVACSGPPALRPAAETPAAQRASAPQRSSAPRAHRLVAEWEPALGAMLAWPLSVPHDLVIKIAKDARLYTLCADRAGCDEAKSWYERWGIDLARVEFLVVPQSSDASWIRDYGPHTLVDDAGRVELADARYDLGSPTSGLPCDAPLGTVQNGGQPVSAAHAGPAGYSVAAEDAAPAAIARALGLAHRPLGFALTGGNLATDGHGLALSTCIQANENRAMGLADDQFRTLVREQLGVARYVLVSNYESTGIQHIDCLLKILDSKRILVARPPVDHPASALIERIVTQELMPLTTFEGKPFEILRIDTARFRGDELAAYANALILNDRVYVPLFGIAEDQRALATWRAAMPGSKVEGFPFVLADEPILAPSTKMYRDIGWNGGDALHCRVRAVFDPARLARAAKGAPR
ncbi:agmatine deiminase family protein [Pendulispora albinea]|uniref:Agmatine deiminase family protein n=1 Tax=Pendulispora albinea TaxID=2741071 RepID=A0ABZ2M4W8_9BACT